MKFGVKGYVDLNLVKGFIDLTIESDEIDQIIGSQETVAAPEQTPVPKAPTTPSYRAGEDLERGDAVYIDPMSRAFKASATKACGGDDSFRSQVDGFVFDNTAKGAEVGLVSNGQSVFPRTDGPLIVGKCVYLSTAPGKVSSKFPTEPGTFRLKLGVARRSDEIAVNIGDPIFNS